MASNTGLRILIDGVEIQNGENIRGVSIDFPSHSITKGMSGAHDEFTFTITDEFRTYQPRHQSSVVVYDNTDDSVQFNGNLAVIRHRIEGTVRFYECTALGLTHLLQYTRINRIFFIGANYQEILADPTGSIVGEDLRNPRGIFYNPTLSGELFKRKADGTFDLDPATGERQSIFDLTDIENVRTTLQETSWEGSSLLEIIDELADGSGSGFAYWVDQDSG